MEFGVFGILQYENLPAVPPRGIRLQTLFRETIAEAIQAEEYGFDHFTLGEHHQLSDGFWSSPLVVLPGLAARTERIRLGTAVVVLPFYHPIRLAEDTATIDQISGGRLVLGLGMGYVEKDFETFGVPIKERASRFIEGLEVMRKAWTEESFSYRGRHFSLDGVSVTPKPLQKPHPPLWIGGQTPRAAERAGVVGDGWVAAAAQPLHEMKELAARYRESARRANKKPYVVVLRDGWVTEKGDDPSLEEFWREEAYRLRCAYRLGAYRDHAPVEESDFTRIAKERAVAGTCEQVISIIERLQAELDPDLLLIHFRLPYAPEHRKALGAIRVFGERVIPRFRGKT